MIERHRRGTVWPICLILIGCCLLLDQLGLWHVAWAQVLQFWPALLVLVGLDLLAGRSRVAGLFVGVLAALAIGLALLYGVIIGGREGIAAGELERAIYSVPSRGIDRATLRLDVGAGRLRVEPQGSGDSLYQAQVVYDPRHALVTHTVEVNGGQANAHIKSAQAEHPAFALGLGREEWLVGLYPEIPLSLMINCGVASSQLSLDRLRLRRLQVNVGVGDLHVALSEAVGYEVFVKAGVGNVVLDIPVDSPARVVVRRGMGTVTVAPRFLRDGQAYVTQGYSSASERIDVDLRAGIGHVTVR